jgi:putative endonuclease
MTWVEECRDETFVFCVHPYNVSRTLDVGITSDLERRVWEHRMKIRPGFAREYNLTMLVYVEEFADAATAIGREKQVKGWRREKKVALIERDNPGWLDLAAEWFGE